MKTSDACTELRTALTRYERLASPPRCLQFPLIGDVQAYIRAELKHRAAGDIARADELAKLLEMEHSRCVKLGTWNWNRRSRKAWLAVAARLESAIEWATRTGVISGDRVTYCNDRLHDAQFRVEQHDVNAKLDALTEKKHDHDAHQSR